MVEHDVGHHARPFLIPHSSSLVKLVHIPDQNRIPVKMDEVGFFQFVQDGRHCLPAGADEVGNILLRQAMFHQGFITHLTAVFAGTFF